MQITDEYYLVMEDMEILNRTTSLGGNGKSLDDHELQFMQFQAWKQSLMQEEFLDKAKHPASIVFYDRGLAIEGSSTWTRTRNLG